MADRARPPRGCAKRDDEAAFEYLIFWPVVAFSFFAAVDAIAPADTFAGAPAALRGAALALVSLVHSLALATLGLATAEAYVAYAHRPDHLCARTAHLEALTAATLGALLLTSVVACFQDVPAAADAAPLALGASIACRLAPRALVVGVSGVRVAAVLRGAAPA
jgi:hypothetical protein